MIAFEVVIRSVVLALVALVVAACGSDPCDEDAIRDQLAHAMPGDTVMIGACTVQGAFVVPDGVTLRGEGLSQSTINSEEGAAISIDGSGRVEVRDLSIISGGRAAIIARGSGERVLHDITVTVSIGVGVAVQDAARLEMTRVSIAGPIDAQNAGSVPANASPMTHATHGLIAVSVADAVFQDVTVRGFAVAGTLLVASDAVWNGGSSSDNLAVGIGVEGGRATFEDFAVARTLQGSLLLPAYGAVFTSNATVSTTRVSLTDNEGFGFLEDTGRGVHTALSAGGNENAAVWAQGVAHFELSGTLSGNKFAGVVLVDVADAVVHDTTIDATIGATRIIEGQPYVVGDGVQVVRSANATVLRDVGLTNNERTGVLFELSGQTLTSASLDRVRVEVANTNQHGALAQNGVKDPNWDANVTRVNVTSQMDDGTPVLQSVQAVGPCNRPRDSQLATMGLMSLIGI